MQHVVGAVLFAVSLLVLLPAAVFFLEVAAGSGSRRRAGTSTPPASTRPSMAVLMPAHDEAAGIARAILAVMQQLEEGDRLLVVADNCTDDTAAVSRTMGAEVLERTDPARRGKGYALDFGVRALAAQPPEVVVIVDADCEVAPGALATLARRCHATGRPAQALYLMHAPAGAPLRMRIAEFAWVVKNKVRPLGAAAFGWPCQLMGTGMAFRWATIERASLASGHLVEDMQLGIEMARSGTPPLFCPEALVSSAFPTDRDGVRSQRTRWEHGHLSMIATAAPRLLASAIRQRSMALLALALDLAVPPLAALAMMLVVSAICTGAWWGLGYGALPFALSASALAMLAVGVMLAWRQEGRRIVTFKELSMLPIYVVAKIPVYVRWVTQRQTQWVRTKRDDRRP